MFEFSECLVCGHLRGEHERLTQTAWTCDDDCPHERCEIGSDMDTVVCVYCGRTGTHGYVISSGNGDGTRDSYACANRSACERRQARGSL